MHVFFNSPLFKCVQQLSNNKKMSFVSMAVQKIGSYYFIFRILSLNLKEEISQEVMMDCEHALCDSFIPSKIAWSGDKLFIVSDAKNLLVLKGK